ncbi:RING-H2 finger protein ATL78 [Lactuca sativa]|uniref:RING-type E3 ubiquitin transferase n=1 Tax=Lactuca sativa TaxID=4236 RepID=A0A9R1W048_LACSA|nr:RING-H2 finger protein ATL78 [Lactuca sativa]KAJ0214739.1 hypothetical protein LSAT_V11C400210920 [Lactuca sativa]
MLTSSMMLFQANFVNHHSRKLLLDAPMYLHASTTMRTTVDAIAASPTPSTDTANKSFDANVVMVLSVLLCALICSLGLNSIIRCVLRCSNLVHSESNTSQESTPARLANTGIKKKALKTFPVVSYWEGLKLPGLGKECVICLSEFIVEEQVKILPKCNHGFHIRCIDKWLSSHSSCPTCRHSLIETCQKILSGGACNSTTPFQGQNPSGVNIISLAPLQPERFVRSYEM